MAEKIREILLRRKEVERRVGLTRSTLYALMHEGKFPKPIPLVGRTVAWKQSSVDQWIEDRIAAAENDVT